MLTGKIEIYKLEYIPEFMSMNRKDLVDYTCNNGEWFHCDNDLYIYMPGFNIVVGPDGIEGKVIKEWLKRQAAKGMSGKQIEEASSGQANMQFIPREDRDYSIYSGFHVSQ